MAVCLHCRAIGRAEAMTQFNGKVRKGDCWQKGRASIAFRTGNVPVNGANATGSSGGHKIWEGQNAEPNPVTP
jgi:hypothetical protein